MTNEACKILLNRIRQVISTVAIFPEPKPGWQPGAGALLDGCIILERWPECSEQELQTLEHTLVSFRGGVKFRHLDLASEVLSEIVEHLLRWELRQAHPVWKFSIIDWDTASRLSSGCPEEDKAWVEWVYTQAPGLRPGSGDTTQARAWVLRATNEMVRALNARALTGEMEKWMPPGHSDYGQGYDPLAPLIQGVQALRRIATEPPGSPGDAQDWAVVDAVHPWAFKQSPDYRKSFLGKHPERAFGVAVEEAASALKGVIQGNALWEGGVWYIPDHENGHQKTFSSPRKQAEFAADWARHAASLWGLAEDAPDPGGFDIEVPVRLWPGTVVLSDERISHALYFGAMEAEDALREIAAGITPCWPRMRSDRTFLPIQKDFPSYLSPQGQLLLNKFKSNVIARARYDQARWRRYEAAKAAWKAAGEPPYEGDFQGWVSQPISEEEINQWADPPESF